MNDETRFTLRQAADLIGCSTDTLRRMRKKGELVCTLTNPKDPNATVYVTAAALVAAGLLSADQAAPGEPEALLGRRIAEKARDADHDELVGLRVERDGLHRENQMLRDLLAKANKLSDTLANGISKARAA